MKAISQLEIKKRNLIRLYDELVRKGNITRQYLARKTGLSLMTICNLIDFLSANGVIDLFDDAKPAVDKARSAGRKAAKISLNNSRFYWVLLDLTTVHFRYTAYNQNLQMIDSATPYSYEPSLDYATNLQNFLAMTYHKLETNLTDREMIMAIAITPGPYDVARDTIFNKRIPELNKIHIKETLISFLGNHLYGVEEDVKLAVRAYLQDDLEIEDRMLYYLYIGEGVGGAVAYNLSVLRGLNAVNGDVGQLLTRDGVLYENAVSIRAFARAIGIDEDMESWDENDLIRAIEQSALEDHENYAQTLNRFSTIIAEMLVNVLWMLDPHIIVVDCSYVVSAQKEFIGLVEKHLYRLTHRTLQRMPQIVFRANEIHNVVIGSSKMVRATWLQQLLGG